MPSSQGNPTGAPALGARSRVEETVVGLIGSFAEVSDWTADWLTVVLVDGDLDDWTRESLGVVLRRHKGIVARFEELRDR